MQVNHLEPSTIIPTDNFLIRPQADDNYLWHDAVTGGFFIDTQLIEPLTPIQRRILAFLITRSGAYLTKTEIIHASWPDGVARTGVSDDALFQQISSLRKLLRRYSQHPFIVTWRGIPEGGYRLMGSYVLLVNAPTEISSD